MPPRHSRGRDERASRVILLMKLIDSSANFEGRMVTALRFSMIQKIWLPQRQSILEPVFSSQHKVYSIYLVSRSY